MVGGEGEELEPGDAPDEHGGPEDLADGQVRWLARFTEAREPAAAVTLVVVVVATMRESPAGPVSDVPV